MCLVGVGNRVRSDSDGYRVMRSIGSGRSTVSGVVSRRTRLRCS